MGQRVPVTRSETVTEREITEAITKNTRVTIGTALLVFVAIMSGLVRELRWKWEMEQEHERMNHILNEGTTDRFYRQEFQRWNSTTVRLNEGTWKSANIDDPVIKKDP